MKKVLLITLVLVFTLCFTLSLVACNKDKGEEHKTTIVYLGDSIAEAIIGPSSLSERDNYGYYALVGKANDYKYYNHSVSGHQTSSGMLSNVTGTHVDGLLEMVSREDEDGALLKTHLQEADIIHISVLGNNALQYDLGPLLLAAADPDFKTNYAKGENLLYHMMHGIEDLDEDDYKIDSMVLFKEDGTTPQKIVYTFPNTIKDISDIVARLKQLNPNAKILFQKVYNPVYDGTTLVNQVYWDELATIKDVNGDFGEKDAYITTWEQRRLVAQRILDVLNGVLDDYVAAHPGDIEILDINKYFEDITNTATGDRLATNSVGAKLLYTDWTHPSNIGHAAIAAATQDWLEKVGLANPNALANYKAIRIEQINRMYKGVSGFNTDAAIAAVNAGTTMTEVSNAYFAKIDGYMPNYYRNNLSYNRSGETYYSENIKFSIDNENTIILLDDALYVMVEGLALNPDECYFEFKKDGTFHAQLQTKAGLLGGIADLLDSFGVDLSGLSDVDLEAAVNSSVTGFFPGFTLTDLKGSLDRIFNSLGVNITGLDWEDDDVEYILDYLANNGKLPSDIFDKIPADTVLTLSYDNDYRIKEVKTSDGKTKKVLYLGGEVAVNTNTQPFIVFEETTVKDDNGNKIKHLEMTVEFIGVTIALNEIK